MVSHELSTRFTWVDYTVFCFMLALSAGIGVFYGCFGTKMKDTKDFLMAGRDMTTFPVAMSLIARWDRLIDSYMRSSDADWTFFLMQFYVSNRSFGHTVRSLPKWHGLFVDRRVLRDRDDVGCLRVLAGVLGPTGKTPDLGGKLGKGALSRVSVLPI